MLLISFKPYNLSVKVSAIFISVSQIRKLGVRGVMTPGGVESHGGMERGRKDLGWGFVEIQVKIFDIKRGPVRGSKESVPESRGGSLMGL